MTDGGFSGDRQDAQFMAAALALAANLTVRPWPNPPVGAVVVKEGAVIGRGAHHGAGQPHAERIALTQAGAAARGATLYCTLEPCNHQGRTPPCAPAVADSGVSRVVIGVADPNPTVAGGGIELLREAGIAVTVGVAAAPCLDLIWPFVASEGFQRPYVELKCATSLDGRFSRPQAGDRAGVGTGEAQVAPEPDYLTGTAARTDVHRRRRWVDLVLVGEETARADRPRLDGRLAGAAGSVPLAEPAAGYVDSDASYRDGLGREPYYLFYGEGLPRNAPPWPAGAQPVPCAIRHGRVDLSDLLDRAAELGLWTIMLEGGPRLATSFLAEDLVDRWVHYTAPLVLGAGARWPDTSAGGRGDLRTWTLTSSDRFAADLRTIYDRCDFAATLRRLTAERAAAAAVTLAMDAQGGGPASTAATGGGA